MASFIAGSRLNVGSLRLNLASLVVVTTTILCVLGQQPSGVDGAPYWGDFSEDGCIAPGYRKYYSRLWDIQGDWMTACQNAPAYINGVYYRQPDNCVVKGPWGMWGEWRVRDSSCDPHWGSFKDDGCKSNGCRQYSSVLWDIPSERSWEDWCDNSWATVNGQYFSRPSRCVDTLFRMWGEFDVADGNCGNCYNRAATVAGGDDFTSLPIGVPPVSPPSDSPSDSPSD